MLASTDNVRRNDGFTSADSSIFIPTVIEFLCTNSSHGFSVSPMGLTMFPPMKDGDNHGSKQDFREQKRN
jgi:hypothetical protein